MNSRATEQFREYRPLTFNGRDGPAADEEWFRSIERIFRMVDCDDTQKIACATYQLIEDAGHWWERFTRNQTEAEQLAFTWENFKTAMNDKYFPQSYTDQKESEFLHLKQGSMTVTEYERKFNELSRFASHLVNTDARRSARFQRGLQPDIARILASHVDLAYSDVVRRAERIESSGKQEGGPKVMFTNEKRKWREEEEDNDNYKKARVERSNEFKKKNKVPYCRVCSKQHFGVCLKGQGKCYRCHMSGHEANRCPRINQLFGGPQGNGHRRRH
ncbi:hypothetical protein CASFOL_038762 [Castilleja foliolosa]|uniref:CCHC-type domain-containing protein n=1 Tax=Castilleja foliolosa TaxID=1961234 RepID=A0ABD3BJG5_9LAMI